MAKAADSPLLRLLDHGQSYWLDNLTRGMIESGALERRVREEGLRGVTSNPSIFQKAITGGSEYDDQIAELMDRRLPVNSIYERLVVDDIRRACDVLRPVYDESEGTDGFVSLEVSPYLAHDTEGSVDEAVRMYEAVDRPNVFIKIPGTDAGVPAVEELLYRGVNVNITLLFSIDAYEAVARAYLRALERRLEEGKSVSDVASVASFFLSRIDVLVDGILGHRLRSGSVGEEASSLMGRAGIANARLAYRLFRELFGGERWERLRDAGAHVQRMLWASTSTKDPLYSDIRYVEPLVGPHTVNTLPERTIRAFADHGSVETTVEEGLEEARAVMARLDEVGIDFDHVTEQLLHEGVQKFIDPYDSLMATLAARYERHAGWPSAGQVLVLGDLEADVEDRLDSLHQRQYARRLHEADPGAWSDDPGTRSAIAGRLGWLALPEEFGERLGELRSFAEEVRPPEFTDVLLLGMGGSCQAARVLEGVFGSREGRPGLTVLDDTSPGAVRAVDRRLDPERTLVLVASKSGETAETRALYRYFWRRAEEVLGAGEAGDRFAAITDPGTPLAREAREREFRGLFENPEDVGGRYSALSFFGLVPGALLGVDVRELLNRAADLLRWHDGSVPAAANPAIRLGAALATLADEGRDKVTFVVDDRLEPLSDWLEQLVAESTGKSGRGLVPLVREGVESPGSYGDDRVFVHLQLQDSQDLDASRRLELLEEAGHPVLRVQLRGPADVGAEFLRWEIAVATAGRVLGVNPFDEPDVEVSKRNTSRLLDRLEAGDGLPAEEPVARGEHLEMYADRGAGWFPSSSTPEGDPAPVLSAALETVGSGDYVALLSFVRATPEREAALGTLRERLRDRLGVATTLSHGPAYLHSTGQLHKGGPDRALFLMITADPAESADVPDTSHGFGELRTAQALADERALRERGRRVLRLHLGRSVEAGLRELYQGLAPREEEPASAAPVSSSA